MHTPGTYLTETVTVTSIYSSTLAKVIPRLSKLMNTITVTVTVPVVHIEELPILFFIIKFYCCIIMSSSLVVCSARPSL